MLKLHYIAHTDYNGDDMGLFVLARDRDEAVRLWHEWELVADAYDVKPRPDAVFEVRTVPAPQGERSRRLDWHKDLVEV